MIRAPNTPKIAAEAPSVGRSGVNSKRAERARQQCREVDRGEVQLPDRGLERASDEPQRQHVQPDVDDAGVQEARGQQPPVLVIAVASSPGPNRTPWMYTPAAVAILRTAPAPVATSHRNTITLITIRNLGDRPGPRIVRLDQLTLAPRLTARQPPHLRALAGALGAAHADRGRRHAVRADRAPAVGARDARLARRVSVTDRHANSDASDPAGPAELPRRCREACAPRTRSELLLSIAACVPAAHAQRTSAVPAVAVTARRSRPHPVARVAHRGELPAVELLLGSLGPAR